MLRAESHFPNEYLLAFSIPGRKLVGLGVSETGTEFRNIINALPGGFTSINTSSRPYRTKLCGESYPRYPPRPGPRGGGEIWRISRWGQHSYKTNNQQALSFLAHNCDNRLTVIYVQPPSEALFGDVIRSFSSLRKTMSEAATNESIPALTACADNKSLASNRANIHE